MKKKRIGIIGAGQMATALAIGFVESGLAQKEVLIVSDPDEKVRTRFAEQTGATTLDDNRTVATSASIIILAVKPDKVLQVLSELSDLLDGSKLIISIAAGVSISTMLDVLDDDARLIRVMPNTPCLIGEGVSAFALGGVADEEDAKTAAKLLTSVGVAFQVEESKIDAVTGLSGSGPAYIFTIIEALTEGGVRMGLPYDVALQLATQTVAGSAQMVAQTGEHPAVLKSRVMSPGGTTIAGVQILEEEGIRAALIAAVETATMRAEDLGAMFTYGGDDEDDVT